MIKKTIKWSNLFTDEEEEKDFYFHINKAELIELEVSYEGGLSGYFQKLVDEDDAVGIVKEIRKLVLISYGVKEGSQFVKSPELRDEFEKTEAFSELLMEVSTDADQAAEFVNGIIPKDLEQEMAALAKKQKAEETKKSKKAAVTE
jgi:hypothetical protein